MSRKRNLVSDVPHKLVPSLTEAFELIQDENKEIGEMQGIMVGMAMGESREQACNTLCA